MYKGKNEFIYAANLDVFKSTKIFLVLNENKSFETSTIEYNKESEKKFYSKMFQIKDYNSRVKLVILDASNKETYLDLWKNIYEFVLKNK